MDRAAPAAGAGQAAQVDQVDPAAAAEIPAAADPASSALFKKGASNFDAPFFYSSVFRAVCQSCAESLEASGKIAELFTVHPA